MLNLVRQLFMGILLFMMISAGSMNALAADKQAKASDSSINYSEEISEDSTSSCNVSVSIPYIYSDTISKVPEKQYITEQTVQTGDYANISGYAILAAGSFIGLCGLLLRRNK